MLFITPNQKYGTIIPNLKINGKPAPYPVVNDRKTRASAGLKLAISTYIFFSALFLNEWWMFSVFIPIFFLEFFFKTLYGPEKSLFGWIGGKMVANQTPVWVGAIQKRFAMGIGLAVSGTMLVLVILGVQGTLPLAICFMCMVFMWMESVLGICVGCLIYGYLVKKGIFKEKGAHPVCPGDVCDVE